MSTQMHRFALTGFVYSFSQHFHWFITEGGVGRGGGVLGGGGEPHNAWSSSDSYTVTINYVLIICKQCIWILVPNISRKIIGHWQNM